jgi:hypothetical protein
MTIKEIDLIDKDIFQNFKTIIIEGRNYKAVLINKFSSSRFGENLKSTLPCCEKKAPNFN